MLVAIFVLVAGWYRKWGVAVAVVLLALAFQVSLLGGDPWSWDRITALGGFALLSPVALTLIGYGVAFYFVGSGVRWAWNRYRNAN